jgi:G3E family GTPase
LIDFYLITGFLGAGKTTFLKNFVRLLAPKKMRIVVNEFGRVGVDSQLLTEVGAALDEINNGSIFCTCRLDKFEEVLEDILHDPPEVVVVEASGLSDPTSIRKVLEAKRFSAYSYKGAICLVDALRFHKVLHTARVCAKQLSVSDLVLVNKTDLATADQIDETVQSIRDRYPDAVIQLTQHGNLEPSWLESLGRNRTEPEDTRSKDLTLQDYTVSIGEEMTPKQLEHFIGMFIEDTYRVKGFVRLGGELYLVDCVGAQVNVLPWAGKAPDSVGTIVVLAGKGMNPRRSIRKAAELYPGLVGKAG